MDKDTPQTAPAANSAPQYPTTTVPNPYSGYPSPNQYPQYPQNPVQADPRGLTPPEKQLLFMLVHRYKEEIPQLKDHLQKQLDSAKNRNQYDPMQLMNMHMNGGSGNQLSPDQTVHMTQQNLHMLDQAIPIVENILRMDKLV